MRYLIQQLHLWVGLPCGLIVAIVGLTGSLYVFQPEISRWLHADVLQVAGSASQFESDQALARHIEQATGGRIESLQWPQRERETYMFKLFGDDTWYYFDQTTGATTAGSSEYSGGLFGFILDLHTTLTMGERGRAVTGIASLLLALILITTGLYLWWPRALRLWRSRFTIRWRGAKAKRINYDLHSVGGFYVALPLFLMAITGAYFYFPNAVQNAVDVVTLSESAPTPWWNREVESVPQPERAPLTITEALDVMDQHYPSYHRRNLWLTEDSTGTISLAYQSHKNVGAGPQPRIFLAVDRYTGSVLADSNPAHLPRGARLTEKWLLPVHFGEFGGLLTRILWFVAGLMPALLLITGICIWWPRWSRQRQTGHRLEKSTSAGNEPISVRRPNAVNLPRPSRQRSDTEGSIAADELG